ncbi:MerR family transcriptional regulator [Paenibacillus thailandensis]|uniref:MerR family transcriptional regulator n=1 Tax=Paenibacillus thailandensis TaxID=393250 RepID=A0ABW5QSM4_9BACL
MYSIGEVSKLTGITASTLRYYESIGLIPEPQRQSGSNVRRYDDADLRFIQFIDGLKQTGMKLGDIAVFAEDGCLLTQDEPVESHESILRQRIEILDRHVENLEQQITRLQSVRDIAEKRRKIYVQMLKDSYQKDT